MRHIILTGDVSDILPTLADSFDAVLCDPPYGLKFMGKAWDHGVPSADIWTAVHRTLKPGAHILAFGGTRTFHRLACAIEDAGFGVRDCLMWLYGSGFPKSANVSKQLGKINGAGGATKLWQGYGTALKPAWEPIVLAMKKCEGTFAANATKHGVAGINIEECRIATTDKLQSLEGSFSFRGSGGANETGKKIVMRDAGKGRWPANLILDDEMLGEASRFFYQAKVSKQERLESTHPTLKPIALTEYLARLLLPPAHKDGSPRRILVPFSGAGSEMIGCLRAGWDEVVGIEMEPEYVADAERRIKELA